MTYLEYSEVEQLNLAQGIRLYSQEHHQTPLYLWRTALEQINPEVLVFPPHCQKSWLEDVYAMLDVAEME